MMKQKLKGDILMKKELTIKDWGMLIGQKIMNTDGKIIPLLASHMYGIQEDISKNRNIQYKPILRTLEQLTEREREVYNKFLDQVILSELDCIANKITDQEILLIRINMYDYLTQIGIDIRGWIKAGLAVKCNKELHGELE